MSRSPQPDEFTPAERAAIEAEIDVRVEEMMASMAKNLYDSASKNTFDLSRMMSVYQILRTESDRALAIVLFAYIEDLVKGFFLEEFNPKAEPGLLLEGTGPLATTSSRLRLAFALNWISDKTFGVINTIRKIRNRFAHEPERASFSRSPVREFVHQLPDLEANILESPLIKPKFDPARYTPRLRFHVRSILACSHMIDELRLAPGAIRRGISPGYALKRWDHLPPELKKTALATTREVFSLLGGIEETAPAESKTGA